MDYYYGINYNFVPILLLDPKENDIYSVFGTILATHIYLHVKLMLCYYYYFSIVKLTIIVVIILYIIKFNYTYVKKKRICISFSKRKLLTHDLNFITRDHIFIYCPLIIISIISIKITSIRSPSFTLILLFRVVIIGPITI